MVILAAVLAVLLTVFFGVVIVPAVETRPVAPETTESGAVYPEGQARNRRVELTVSS